jgi:uncharacterized protein YycO
MYEPQIGDYGVVKTKGFFGRLIRIGTTSRWNHAVIHVGSGEVVSADPSGVKINPASDYTNIAWNKHEELTLAQREQIALYARSLVGKPYDFLTIADLAFRILGLKIFSKGILEKLARHRGYICSELVSECYRKAGVDLCGKEDYLVVPGDLAERLIYQ